jgi:uncharacterized protein (TIGR03437 family)
LAGSTPPQAIAPVSAQVGGVDAQVQYAGGAPNFIAGLFQVNVRIPDSAPVGPAVSLQLTAGGVSSAPGVTLAVQ